MMFSSVRQTRLIVITEILLQTSCLFRSYVFCGQCSSLRNAWLCVVMMYYLPVLKCILWRYISRERHAHHAWCYNRMCIMRIAMTCEVQEQQQERLFNTNNNRESWPSISERFCPLKIIPRWHLRNIFARFPKQLLKDLISLGRPGGYSMIGRLLGDASGGLSCQLWSTVLLCGARLPIHTLNYWTV